MTPPNRCELLINIDVPDVDVAARFYVETLGLSVGRRLGEVVELLGAAVPIYLLPKPAGSSPFAGAPNSRTYGRHWTPVHIDVAVSDVEAARSLAVANGAQAEGDVTDHVWGRMALMVDPFGHGFCLLQFKGRGYDELV